MTAVCVGLADCVSSWDCHEDWSCLGVTEVTQEGDVEEPAVPLPADLGQGSDLRVRRGAALEVRPKVQVTTKTNRRVSGDDWFVWVLALASIAVPVIVLVCVDSIPKDAFAWHGMSTSIHRGDFLIPATALCVETIRRWWRDVDLNRMKAVRLVATFICAATGLVCVIAMTTAASLPVTAQIGSSIAVITCSCLVVGVTFGTLAVSASGSEVGQ
jgi:hypothetical protein